MDPRESSPRFIRIEDIVKGIMRREKDFMGSDKLVMESIAKDLYKELNLASVRMPIRRIIEIDKRTNTINLPDDYMNFSSISVIDDCGHIDPLIINTNIKSDLIDVSLIKECGCECGCKSSLCTTIKNYELIQEDISIVMPDNTTRVFTATTRKKIMNDGSYVLETIMPTKQYVDGVYTAVVMETKDEFLCHLELDTCGCIQHSHKNEETVNNCSNARDYATDCGCTICNREDHNTYNFSEEGDRIKLGSSFRHDSVLLRYYPDRKTKDILVPIVARKTMVSGIMSEKVKFDKKETQFRIAYWANEYNNDQISLRSLLNEINIISFFRTFFGHRKMV